MRVALWLLGIAVVLWGAFLLLGELAEQRVRSLLTNQAASWCAEFDPMQVAHIEVDLWTLGLRLTDVHFQALDACDTSAVRVHGTIDSLVVKGIGLSTFLKKRSWQAGGLWCSTHALTISLPHRTEATDGQEQEPDEWKLDLGTFVLNSTATTIQRNSTDTAWLKVASFALSMESAHLQWQPQQRFTTAELPGLAAQMDSLELLTAEGYRCSIAHYSIDRTEGSAMFGFHLRPRIDLVQYGISRPYEYDVFDVTLDTLLITPVDPEKGLRDDVWEAGHVELRGADITVLRDRTVRDGPRVIKPLLSRLVRMMPSGSGVDSLRIVNLNVAYHERSDVDRGFAVVPFTQLNALVTGIRNASSGADDMHISATSLLFQSAPVSMELHTHIRDSTDKFTVEATLGSMPFAKLNPALGPMFNMQVVEGTIHSINYELRGNDRTAQGVVRMNYEGLKLDAGASKRGRPLDAITNALVNLLVKNDQSKGKKRDRTGKFTLERKRDKAVTNYLWSGLREGCKLILLPDLVTGKSEK